MRSQVLPGGERIIAAMLIATIVTIPFSVKLYARSIDLEVIFPAEPLIAATALISVWHGIRLSSATCRGMLKNPVVLAVLAFMVASLLSTVTSTMPLVSLKALVVRLSYVTVFFFAPLMLSAPANRAQRYLLLHAWLLLPIALWTMAAQVEGGFDRASAGFVSYPFYIDRTIYSAALSFGAIALLVEASGRWNMRDGQGRAVFLLLGGLLLSCAVLFSYTRAAWLGMGVAGCCAVSVCGARRRPRATLVLVVLGGVATLLIARGPGSDLRAETNASDHRTGITATLRSFTNMRSDPSNMERLNRWSCARRMFLDRPILGHGPATYQFAFFPYQRAEERTPISPPDTAWVNRRSAKVAHGRAIILRPPVLELEYSGGSAHSEYLLALSEGGALGGLTWLGVIFAGLFVGCLRWWRGGAGTVLAPMAFLGLVAYAVHGIFNNYLDDCKLAMPFWVSLAAVAASLDARSLPPRTG